MSRLQTIKSAERSNDQLGKLFNQLGTADHPRGKILLAYRQAHRALRDALQREALQEVNEIMGWLEVDIGGFANEALTEAAKIGFESGQRQLKEYGVDAVGWEDPGISYMQDVWMNQVRDQAGRANALLLSGGDPALVLGSSVRKGIVRPDSIINSGVRWLGIAMATSWKNTTTKSADRAGIVFLRQAIAAIDEKTTSCCLEVHGQVVGLDEPFHLTGTPRFADQMKDPPFHDYCRTSQALVRPSDVGDQLTQQMKDAASQEMEYREEQAAKIAELKQRLAELGVAPDGRARATDTEEIRKLREQLKAAKIREPLSPASALSRRVSKMPVEKKVPGEELPGIGLGEVALAPAFVGWSVEDKEEAQEVAKKIRRYKRKWERGELTTEQFMEKAGDLIAKHQSLNEKYGGESRFMVLVRTKVPPSLQPTLIKPTPTGKADFGGVREQYLSLRGLEKEREISYALKLDRLKELDQEYIRGYIGDAEYEKKAREIQTEIATLKMKIDASIKKILELPEGMDRIQIETKPAHMGSKKAKTIKRYINELGERMGSRNLLNNEVFVIHHDKEGRSCWDGFRIILGAVSRRDVQHEFGHYLEDNDPVLRKIALAFRKHRTKGEAAVPLGRGYEPNEITKKDKFFNKYVGKIYGGNATEVISMGLEYIMTKPDQLLADPEHFDLIVNVLRGTEREWAEAQDWYQSR